MLCHISMLTLPAVLGPVSEEFGLSLTEITAVGTAAYLLFGLGSLPAGFLAGVSSAKLTLTLFFLGTGASALLIALAPSFPVFVAGMVLLGISASMYHVSGPTLISHFSKRAGRSFGVLGVAGSAGITLAPLVAAVMANWIGWRSAYAVLLIPAVAGSVLLLVDRQIPSVREPVGRKQREEVNRGRILIFALLMIVGALTGFIYRAFLTMLPTYLAESISISNISPVLSGGVLSSVILAFGMIGQYTGGRLADSLDRFKLYATILIVVAPLLVIIGVASGWMVVVAAVVFSVIYFASLPVENSILGSFVPPRLVSSMFGVKYIVTFGLGSLGSVYSGYVTETWGASALYASLGPIIALGSVTVFVAMRLRGRPRQH